MKRDEVNERLENLWKWCETAYRLCSGCNQNGAASWFGGMAQALQALQARGSGATEGTTDTLAQTVRRMTSSVFELDGVMADEDRRVSALVQAREALVRRFNRDASFRSMEGSLVIVEHVTVEEVPGGFRVLLVGDALRGDGQAPWVEQFNVRRFELLRPG